MVVQRVVKCKHRVIVGLFARYFRKYTSKLSSQLPSKIFSYNTAHFNNLTIIQLQYTASLHAVSSILRIPSLRLKRSRIDKVCYSTPGMQGGSGVLSRMCLSVFVFVHKHIPEQTTRPILTKFFMHVTYDRGSVLLWWRRGDTQIGSISCPWWVS